VFADGRNVEAGSDGSCWDWPKYSGGLYRTEEAEAKVARRGVWVDDKATNLHWATRATLMA
jgi:endonuclease YncB( thermonuclease family)